MSAVAPAPGQAISAGTAARAAAVVATVLVCAALALSSEVPLLDAAADHLHATLFAPSSGAGGASVDARAPSSAHVGAWAARGYRRPARTERVCDAAESPRMLEGDAYGADVDAHLFFVATRLGGGRVTMMRKVLEDISMNSNASVVIHMLVDHTDSALPELLRALPACEGLAYRLWDWGWTTTHVGYRRLCADVFGTTAEACIYLVKPYLHEMLPASIDVVLVLDMDMRVLDEVVAVFDEHLPRMRATGAVLGLAADMQTLYMIEGFGGQGYNGGVALLDLDGMRASAHYRAFIANVSWAGTPWPKGTLLDVGDSTLWSLLNFSLALPSTRKAAPHLIHTLPCTWHLTLCTVWHGDPRSAQWPWLHPRMCAGCGPIHVLHGNGGTYGMYRLYEDHAIAPAMATILAPKP